MFTPRELGFVVFVFVVAPDLAGAVEGRAGDDAGALMDRAEGKGARVSGALAADLLRVRGITK